MVTQNVQNNSKISKLLLTYNFMYDIIGALSNLGIAQMVARYLGVVEAVGSNPATQTNRTGVLLPSCLLLALILNYSIEKNKELW